MISIQGVTKNYGRKVAVDNLSLEIAPGEFFAVLGHNGAGKTTTIKMIAGLLRPTSGQIIVGGVDVQKDPIAAKKACAYVPDQPFLYDKLSGIEFMNFIADLYGVDGEGRAKEIDRLVELFGMKDFVRELTEAYSHGMKQRLVLAATLLHKPRVILVDEPLVGLDPHTARLVKQVFRDQARGGTSIFLSTHVLSVAEDFADRIGIMSQGKLVALGKMDDLRRQAQLEGRLEDVFFKITEGAVNPYE
ncbi:MAG TPA: ABC transporter ATP-binding protein [Planctomycetota bacterium]|jgi:ABC-2 type transport system ATP-binding protein|nr:ABC transporter ATP-binding protein [Planctomycetota bacterium]